MACLMDLYVRIITGAFQDEARIWWDLVMALQEINLRMSPGMYYKVATMDEFKAELDGKYFHSDVWKMKERDF